MPRGNRFRRQEYRSQRPTSSYRLLPSGPPNEPSSPEFAERLTAAGAAWGRANVAAVYLVHGTFCGNDPLGLLTELARYAPGVSESLRRFTKGAFDSVLGETGNYTAEFAARLESALSTGAGRTIPVRRFNWSSQNTHIGRADGAVRLIDQLSGLASSLSPPAPSPSVGRAGEGGEAGAAPPRIVLWAHSHGGNVLALVSNLLGGDTTARREFFNAARSFYHSWRSARIDFPAWERVEEQLIAGAQPLGGVALDMVTFGTPIRYGWETSGYAKLLHMINHRPVHPERHWLTRHPPRLRGIVAAADGDFVQQIGIAGSGFPPNPFAWRTFAANRRLRKLLAGDHSRWLLTHLKARARVPHEGTTLLVDYADPARNPLRHLFGHAAYTRSRWLPLHVELVAEHFYGELSESSPDVV